MRKIKFFFFNLIMNWFLKYWVYTYHYFKDGKIIVTFANGETLRDVEAETTDVTPMMNPGYYGFNVGKLDASWVFGNIKLKSQKTIKLYIAPREKKEYYMKDFKAIQKEKDRMEHQYIDMDCVMDIEVKVFGEGNGLTLQDRQEIIKFLKNTPDEHFLLG